MALSGGINTYGEFPAHTRAQYCVGVAFFLLRAGWKLVEKVKANASLLATSLPGDGATWTFAGETYTFKSTINNAVPRQVKIGSDIPTSFANLAAAVNLGAGQGSTYSNATFINGSVSLESATASGGHALITARARRGGPDGTGIVTDAGTLLGGGYRLEGQSPQDRTLDGTQFRVHVYVYDNQHNSGSGGHPPQASIRIESAYDGTLFSTEYHSEVGGLLRYRIICCQCQAFVYRESVDASPTGSVVCFGIPWVPMDKCGTEVQTIPTNEVWFISSDEGNTPSATPRTMVVDQERVTQTAPDRSEDPSTSGVTNVNTWQSSDACFNGTLVVGFGSNSNTGHFRMVSLTPPNRWDITLSSGGTVVNSLRWFGLIDPDTHDQTYVPMLLEPIVAWANIDNTNPPLLRGQFYDAWIRTQQEDMDATSDGTDMMATNIVQAGLKFIAFTDQSKFGTLWLIVPKLTPDLLETFQASYAN